MRVLFVINAIDATGGAENVTVKLAIGLKEKYGYVCAVAYVFEIDKAYTRKHGIMDIGLREELLHHDIPCFSLQKKPYTHYKGALRALWLLWKTKTAFRPHLIHSHGKYPDILTALTGWGVPKLRTMHCTGSYVHAKYGKVLSILSKAFKKSVMVSASLQDFWVKTPGIKRAQCVVIPNHVRNIFYENPRVRSLPVSGTFQLGIVGRMVPAKGHEFLIDIIEKLCINKQVVLHIVGDGPLRQAITDKITQKGLSSRVIFRGVLTPEQIRDFYHDIHLLIAPSVFEGFNLTVYEALATGLPVVTTHVEGMKDIAKRVGAPTFPYGEVGAGVAAVTQCMEHAALYQSISQKGMEALQDYTAEKSVSLHHRLYQDYTGDI